MMQYIARRLLLAIFVVWVMTMLVFSIILLPPGDAVSRYIEELELQGFTVELKEAAYLREYYGLNDPFYERYVVWLWRILHWDFGDSFDVYAGTSTPVEDIVGERMVFTIILSAFTIMVTWVVAIPIGIYSAVRQHSVGDYVFTFLGFSGLAVPDFLLGLVLMYIAFAYFDQVVGGLFGSFYQDAPWTGDEFLLGFHWAKAWDLLQHMWIPAVVIGTAGTAGLIRVMRNNLLDELNKPYVVTARAKGMANWKAIVKYPVRIAFNPFISGIGGMLPALMSASAIVSIVLSLPTLGPTLLNAIRFEDVYLSGFTILIFGTMTTIGVLISDLLLVVVDPRIRLMNE